MCIRDRCPTGMLPPMYPHVFTSLLMVTLATPALAHGDKAACDDDHARAAAQTAGALKPGAVLVRGDPLPKNQAPLPLTAVLNTPEAGKEGLVVGVGRR